MLAVRPRDGAADSVLDAVSVAVLNTTVGVGIALSAPAPASVAVSNWPSGIAVRVEEAANTALAARPSEVVAVRVDTPTRVRNRN